METMTDTTVSTSAPIALNNRAMTVALRMSQWTARKYDKTVSDEIEQQHNARDAGRFNKMLVSKEAIKEVTKAAGRIRAFHLENTLPWNDNGERLLPSTNYLTYINELNELRKEFDQAVNEFVANYDFHVQEARNRLGDMFRESDYPSKKEIETKFGIKPVYLPVPDTDFRVGLGSDELSKLKTAAEVEIQERLKDAMKDLWTRIKNTLTPMYEKLSDQDATFKSSLFGNLEELLNILPRLNLTNDPHIQDICTEMRKVINDPDNVRSDNGLRATTAKGVEDIMNKYKDFF